MLESFALSRALFTKESAALWSVSMFINAILFGVEENTRKFLHSQHVEEENKTSLHQHKPAALSASPAPILQLPALWRLRGHRRFRSVHPPLAHRARQDQHAAAQQ